jgi:hypothetical protein
MKRLILCSTLFSIVTYITCAADIDWQSPSVVFGASDVSTLGLYFGSWAPWKSSNYTVNGVTFQNYTDLPDFSKMNLENGYTGFNNPNTADASYNTLLQGAAYASHAGDIPTITWGGMIPGNTYQIQLWANDGRSGFNRTQTVTGGANTSATMYLNQASYIIGTFVADSTGYETLDLTGTSAALSDQAPMINMLLVRDISAEAAPEPATFGLMVLGGAGMFCFHRKCFSRRKNF